MSNYLRTPLFQTQRHPPAQPAARTLVRTCQSALGSILRGCIFSCILHVFEYELSTVKMFNTMAVQGRGWILHLHSPTPSPYTNWSSTWKGTWSYRSHLKNCHSLYTPIHSQSAQTAIINYYTYGHFLVITGYFYGIIHSINGVVLVLKTGIAWALTVSTVQENLGPTWSNHMCQGQNIVCGLWSSISYWLSLRWGYKSIWVMDWWPSPFWKRNT